MNFTYENQGTNTYLVYEIQPGDEIDSMSLGMLTNNNIPGFAAASFLQVDTSKFIKYNVSARVSVAQLFSGPVNKKRLLGVFTSVINAIMASEDYMIDVDTILLDLDHIYADVSTCEAVLICLPVTNASRENTNLGAFFKDIIFNTQFDQTENCDHVAKILNYLNSSPMLSLPDFKRLLESIENPGVAAQPQAQPPQPQAVQSQPVQHQLAQPPHPQMPGQPVRPAQPMQQMPPMQQAGARPVPNQVPPAQPGRPPMPQPQQGSPAIPPVAAPGKAPNAVPAPAAQSQADEKPMSFMYLMQHYNKENAAIYKAQQEAKKNAAKAPKTSKPGKAPQNAPAPGFAVPGQQPPAQRPAAQGVQPGPGFAVPGQQPPAQRPAPQGVQPRPGFAVPGQQPPVQQSHVQQPPVQRPPVQQPAPRPVQPAAPMQPAPVFQQPQQSFSQLNFGETTVLGGGIGETTVLGGAMETTKTDPHLIRTKNNERIPLNKPVFRIGKEKSYVDYFIGDNTAISRSHANIINRNGEFFVVDTNSTNHTYVNGGMIHSNEEVKLSHGTKIRFANEDFEFKMY